MTRPTAVPRSPATTFLLLALAAAFAPAAAGMFATSRYSLVPAAVLAFVYLGVLFANWDRAANPFSPAGRLFLWLSISVVVRPIYLVITDRAILMAGVRPEIFFGETCLLLGLSVLAFHLGFRRSLVKQLATSVPYVVFRPRPRTGVVTKLLVIYGIAWVVRLFLADRGVFHRQSAADTVLIPIKSWLDMLTDWGTAAFVVALGMYWKRQIAAIYVVALVAAEILAGLLSGGRSGVILPLIWVATTYSLVRRPIRWRWVVVAVVVLIAVVAPVLTLLRGNLYQAIRPGERVGFENIYKSVTQTADTVSSEEYGKDYGEDMTERFGIAFDGALRVSARVPEVLPYEQGATFMPGVVNSIIPRVLWAGKPVLSFPRQIGKLFYDDPTSELIGTFYAIGIPAELYYNFGWWGPLGMICPWCAVRILHRPVRYISEGRRPHGPRAPGHPPRAIPVMGDDAGDSDQHAPEGHLQPLPVPRRDGAPHVDAPGAREPATRLDLLAGDWASAKTWSHMSYDNQRYWSSVHEAHSGSLDAVGYTGFGPGFNGVAYRTRRAAVERAIRRAFGTQVSSLFEGAVGTGAYAALWRRLGVQRWVGADIAEAAIGRLRAENPQHAFITCDLAALDGERLDLGRFDVVTAIDVLYHLVNDAQYATALGNLAGLVRPGGILVVSDVFVPGAPLTIAAHVRRRPLANYLTNLPGFNLVTREPVFAILGDPVRRPHHPGDEAMFLAWRIIQKIVRMTPDRARPAVGALAAAAALPLDWALRRAGLSSGINLELAVFRRTDG